jgi:hypothetical protein
MAEPAGDVTYCSECDYRIVLEPRDGPFRWLCLRHKRRDAVSFVDRRELIVAPYVPCHKVNFGACPLFEPARGVEPTE